MSLRQNRLAEHNLDMSNPLNFSWLPVCQYGHIHDALMICALGRLCWPADQLVLANATLTIQGTEPTRLLLPHCYCVDLSICNAIDIMVAGELALHEAFAVLSTRV